MDLKTRLLIEATALATLDRRRAQENNPAIGRCIEARIIEAHLEELEFLAAVTE
jgi:hypothetical protein